MKTYLAILFTLFSLPCFSDVTQQTEGDNSPAISGVTGNVTIIYSSEVEALKTKVAEHEREINNLKSDVAQNPSTISQAKSQELQELRDDRDRTISKIELTIERVDHQKRSTELALALKSDTFERAFLENDISKLSQLREVLENMRDAMEELSKYHIRDIKVRGDYFSHYA